MRVESAALGTSLLQAPGSHWDGRATLSLRCRLQGSGAEQQWESVSMPVPPHSTIYDLRQRIAHTGLHGSTVGANDIEKVPHKSSICFLFACQQQVQPCSRRDSSGQLRVLAATGLWFNQCACM